MPVVVNESEEKLSRLPRCQEQERLDLEREKIALEWYNVRQARHEFIADTACALNLILLASLKTVEPNVSSWAQATAHFAVGQRICRWWEGNKRFYPGHIVESKVVNDHWHHYVVYDDGDEAWESDVVDVNDPDLPICQRTASCWKMAGHCGKCIGMTAKNNTFAMNRCGMKRRKKLYDDYGTNGRWYKPTRQAPYRLAEDVSWSSLQSRRWSSFSR